MYKIGIQPENRGFHSHRLSPIRDYYMAQSDSIYKSDHNGADAPKKVLDNMGRRLSVIQTALLSKFTCRSTYSKTMKEVLSGKSCPDAMLYRNFYAQLFTDVGFHGNANELSMELVAGIHLLAQEIALEANRNGNLPKLIDAINYCRSLISPYDFSIFVNAQGQFGSPHMDICSREDLNTLTHFLGICTTEDIYQILFEPAIHDENHEDRAAIFTAYEKRAKISKKLMSFISPAFRKKAERVFIDLAAAQYEYIVNFMMEHGYKEAVFQNTQFNAIADLQRNRFDDSRLRNQERDIGDAILYVADSVPNLKMDMLYFMCAEDMRDTIVSCDRNRIEKLFGCIPQNADLALIGFLFLVSEDNLWGAGWIMPYILSNLTTVSKLRTITNFVCIADEDYSCTQKESKPRARQIITDVQKLFTDTDALAVSTQSAGKAVPMTNRQLLMGFGLWLANPEKLSLSDKVSDALSEILSKASPLPDSIAGAIAAMTILDRGGLLCQNDREIDDRVELAQAAAKAKEQEAVAQKRIKELETALATKESTIERKNRELLECSRSLAAKDKEIAALKDDTQELRQRYDEVMEVLAQVDEDDAGDSDEDCADIDLKALESMHIINCGGTDRFASMLSEALPMISTYHADRIVPASALRVADAVFVQTSFISHGFYYPIRDICKQYNIPLFIYTSKSINNTVKFIYKNAMQVQAAQQKAS